MRSLVHKLGLNKPYPYDVSAKTRLLTALVFSAFVTIFLFVFQPFRISSFHEHTAAISIGYGVVCLVIMLFLNLVFVKLFPKYFDENTWTTSRQIFWTLINVFLIGFGNYAFSLWLKIIPTSIEAMIQFQFFTLSVGAFPVVISSLFNQARLQKHYDLNSTKINTQIHNQNDMSILMTEDVVRDTITIPSQYAQENLEIEADKLVFIRAADNYIEVFYKSKANLQKMILRNSMKSVGEILDQNNFFRCHKSFLVNLNYVTKVSGNAQGYKLHLEDVEEPIPVSRTNNEFLKRYFSK